MSGAKRIANPVVARKPQESTIITEVKKMAVRSVYPSRLKYIGTISGQSYEWAEAGAIVMVLPEDVPVLLEKRIGSRACCGALNNGNQVFELVNKEAQ
jgi:hypothetical protein